MKGTEKKINYNSDDAATQKTITGWVSSTGRFFGQDEHMARYDGSTHMNCDCGNEYQKGYTMCASCRLIKENERYLKLEHLDWDEVTPVYSDILDKNFFSVDELGEYIQDDEELWEVDLMLFLCAPNHYSHINEGQWDDLMPEDSDGDLDKGLLERISELNKYIDTLKPLSWSPSNKRTSYVFIPDVS